MNDAELSAAVARVEGWTEKPSPFGMDRDGRKVWEKGDVMMSACPDYATDWYWCGQLVEKYIEMLQWDRAKPSRQWMAMAKSGILVFGDPTPRRAICMAVIEASKKK